MKGKNLLILVVIACIAVFFSAVALASLAPKETTKDESLTTAQGPLQAPIDKPPEKMGGPGGKMGAPPDKMGGQRPDKKGPVKGSPQMMPLVTREQVEKFEKWIKTNDPDKYQEIQDLKSGRPEIYLRVVSEGIRHMNFLEMMKMKDPKTYQRLMKEMKLDSGMRKLAKEYRESEDEKRKKEIKSQLTQLLNQIFDIRSENRAHEVDRMAKKVEELKQMLKKRKENKNLIVERKLKEITGQMEGLEW